MPIKLLALDIDGTLLNSRGEMTPRNLSSIDQARRRGVHVVLLTGRRFGSAYMLMQELGLDLPLICHNGALTKETKTFETTNLHSLEIDIAQAVIKSARAIGADMILCCDEPRGPGKMVIEGVSEENKSLQRYLAKYKDALVKVDDLISYIEESPIQVMFSGPCARMEELDEHLQSTVGDRIRSFKTRYPKFDVTVLDIVSSMVSKGESLAALAARHTIPRTEVMAVGDNHNDVSMLSYAGLGVLMANAEEDLKNMGFASTSSNDEDGVALAIERHILNQSQ